MAVNLRKPDVSENAFSCEDKITSSIHDSYCSVELRESLIHYCSKINNNSIEDAAILVDIKLEKIGCTNEFILCRELNNILFRFTGKDKKLDDKEREDLIQMVCKPRVGFVKGLSLDIAEKSIIEYCRKNQVKVKMGLWRWEIP
jgi:hypothetical protein